MNKNWPLVVTGSLFAGLGGWILWRERRTIAWLPVLVALIGGAVLLAWVTWSLPS